MGHSEEAMLDFFFFLLKNEDIANVLLTPRGFDYLLWRA